MENPEPKQKDAEISSEKKKLGGLKSYRKR